MTIPLESPEKLPLWRLIAGIAVLGGFAAVIAFLTPVYLDDLRLHRYVVVLAAAPDTASSSEETVRAEVIARAHELDLPVRPNDIHILHNEGKTQIEMTYRVKVNLGIYPVDLHFPTIR